VTDHPRAAVYAALRLGVRTGVLTITDGPRRSRLYRQASVLVSRSVPPVSRDAEGECPAPIRGGHYSTHAEDASVCRTTETVDDEVERGLPDDDITRF
jgi:hypothetical protein